LTMGCHEVFVLSGFYCKAHCSNDVLSPQCSLHFTQCEVRRQIICSYLSLVNSWLPLAQFVYLEKIWCKKMQAGNLSREIRVVLLVSCNVCFFDFADVWKVSTVNQILISTQEICLCVMSNDFWWHEESHTYMCQLSFLSQTSSLC